MKKLLILFFINIFFFIKVYADDKNYTGINYDDVFLSTKTVTVLNPSELIYVKGVDRIVFEDKTSKNMKTAGYWISKIENPDKVILSKKEIRNLNEKIYKMHLGISKLQNHKDTITSKRLTDIFNKRLSWMIKKDFYSESGDLLLPGFFVDLYENIDIPNTDTIEVKYAITTKYNDVRLFPTQEKVLSKVTSKDIDKLQEESLDTGTPVIVLCQTKDKDWTYVLAPTEEGWIKTENLAFTDKKTFNKWLKNKNIVVVTVPKADIFTDKNKTKFLEYLRMGTKLPYVNKKGNHTICVKVPVCDENGNLKVKKAYMNYSEINIGHLPYTQRNALILAFKHLNSPYGWGGANAEQDCSGYLGQIFNCFGILLPETSVQKIKCGEVIKLKKNDEAYIKNTSIIQNGVEGISFIYLPGHIMLYVGSQDFSPYVIHAIWGVTSYNSQNNRALNHINKVIVSDLNIGEEVAGNSLIDRVTKFNIIK